MRLYDNGQSHGFMNMDILPLRRVKLPSCETLIPYLQRIDASGWYSNFGPLLAEFEGRLASHFGCEPTQLTVVANATAALELALMSRRKGYSCRDAGIGLWRAGRSGGVGAFPR